MKIVLCAVISYLIGCINPSFIFAKIKGFDIRSRGSGNAGASNAVITMGKAVGLFSAVFDIFKAWLATFIGAILCPDVSFIFAIASGCCILGHIFPFPMGFKGGKGLACLGGTVLSYSLKLFLILLGIEAVLVLCADYICVVPITASVAFAVIYGIQRKDVVGTVIFAVISAIMVLKHIENIKRIKNGTEMHVSYLWHPKKEKSRMEDVLGKESEK